jgi:hypothetical protein
MLAAAFLTAVNFLSADYSNLRLAVVLSFYQWILVLAAGLIIWWGDDNE